MNHKLLNCLAVGALGTALALAAPAFARGGFGGGMGGMHGGGMGGMGAAMHGGAMGGMGRAMPVGAMGGPMRFGASPQFNGTRFANASFANARFANAAFSPRFSSFGFRQGFHHRFFHHRFNRFAFFGAPFAFAAYDSCWSEVWTAYGPQWVNVCANYWY